MLHTAKARRDSRLDAAMELDWERCHRLATDTVVGELAQMGAGTESLEHAAHLRLYYRVSFFLACWAEDPDQRRRLSCDLAMHVVAMKLLDDLVDDDSGLDRFELGGGCLRLLTLSCLRLAQHGNCIELLQEQEMAFDRVCRGQIVCKHQPANDLDTWLRYADDYGSVFLGFYGRCAGLAAGLGEQAEVPERFARSFGLIITIADDLTDYHRHGERVGNLGALLTSGRASAAELERLLGQHQHMALEAAQAQPTAHDLRPVVDLYCNDVITRLLPAFVSRVPSRQAQLDDRLRKT